MQTANDSLSTDRRTKELPAYLLEVGLEDCAASLRAADGRTGRIDHTIELMLQFDGSYSFRAARHLPRRFGRRPYAEVRGLLRAQGRTKTLLEVTGQVNSFFPALLATLARNLPVIAQFAAFVVLATLVRQPWVGDGRLSSGGVGATISFVVFMSAFFFIAGVLLPCIVIAAGEPKRITRFLRDRILEDAAQAAREARKRKS